MRKGNCTAGLINTVSRWARYVVLNAAALILTATAAIAAHYDVTMRSTLTAMELDKGDTLTITLMNGEQRTFVLHETDARIVYTNLQEPKKGFYGGMTIYAFSADISIDGHPITLKRYNPVQASLYEPMVINGLRIWFDGVGDIENLLNENHGESIPDKDARFLFQDMTHDIAPEPVGPWYPNPDNYINVADSYNGMDLWMGPYYGADSHGGLDINMPMGTPIWAPFNVDRQWLSKRNNGATNGWHGEREWENGDVWALRVGHFLELLNPERQAVERGQQVGWGAGTAYGSGAHSHFNFTIQHNDQTFEVDPWIIHWQAFENNKRATRQTRALMKPLSPARTGTAVTFESLSSAAAASGGALKHYWQFGDGGFSDAASPSHVYTAPGIYRVTLIVDDYLGRDMTSQLITVDGPQLDIPVISLTSEDDISFAQKSAVEALETYGEELARIPQTLNFVVNKIYAPVSQPYTVKLENTGGGTLGQAEVKVSYMLQGADAFMSHPDDADYDEAIPFMEAGAARKNWLTMQHEGTGNDQRLVLSADASGLWRRGENARLVARIEIHVPGAENSPAIMRAVLEHPPQQSPTNSVTRETVIASISDRNFYQTPYFWLQPKFSYRWDNNPVWPAGYNRYYLINGYGRDAKGQLVRFTPRLKGGMYRVAFNEETPFRPMVTDSAAPRYKVRIKHADGISEQWVSPAEDRTIGTFNFHWGESGFVEILAEEAEGLVVVDALTFTPVGDDRLLDNHLLRYEAGR